MLTVKSIENKTMHSVQELHFCTFSPSARVILAIVTSSTVSVHSSTELRSANLSTNLFLYSQFLHSKYSLKLQDLYHSHSQLLGFQINPLSHTSLSNNSLHSHLHLSSFQRCLLLQTLLLNLHLHLRVSCHFMHLVSLIPHTRLNTLTFKFFTTSGTLNFASGLLILLKLPLHLLV